MQIMLDQLLPWPQQLGNDCSEPKNHKCLPLPDSFSAGTIGKCLFLTILCWHSSWQIQVPGLSQELERWGHKLLHTWKWSGGCAAWRITTGKSAKELHTLLVAIAVQRVCKCCCWCAPNVSSSGRVFIVIFSKNWLRPPPELSRYVLLQIFAQLFIK